MSIENYLTKTKQKGIQGDGLKRHRNNSKNIKIKTTYSKSSNNRIQDLGILRENQNIVNQEFAKEINKSKSTNHEGGTNCSQISIIKAHQNKVSKQQKPKCIKTTIKTLEQNCDYKSNENPESTINIKKGTRNQQTAVGNKYTHILNDNKLLLRSCHSIKQQGVPIYKTKFVEEAYKNTNKADLYEFNEDVPTIEKSTHYYNEFDSALDKHEVQRYEESEIPIQNNGPKKKTYNNIVDGIVQNVMGKILSRELCKNKKNTVITDLDSPANIVSACHNSYKVSNTSIGVDLPEKVLQTGQKHFNSLGSPWRINWVTPKPIFISVKSNALPRIDQEVVLDHTLVENFEESCIKKDTNNKKPPARKPLVQQSILSYIDSDQIQDDKPLEISLFDSDMFNSPIKNTLRPKKIISTDNGKNIIVASTPVQNTPQDTGETFRINLTKRALFDSDIPNNPIQTPLKIYAAKNKNIKYKSIRVSLNNEDDILMSPTFGKKRKASFDDDAAKVCKKFKENNLEVEQDFWIEKFNQECEEISNYNLHIE